MGLLNLSQFDTTPGTGLWCAPPAPVADYTAWLRERYATQLDVKHYLTVIARQVALQKLTVTYLGPYAAEAKSVIDKMVTCRDRDQTKSSPDPAAGR